MEILNMSLLDFIKTMVPNLDKDDIMEDIRITKDELVQIAIPSYEEANTFFGNKKFKSKSTLDLVAVFERNYRSRLGKRTVSVLDEIGEALKVMHTNLKATEDAIETLVSKTTITETITARKAVLVRMAEQMSYASRMSIDFLNLIYTYEQIEANVEYAEVTVYQKKHVIPNIALFAKVLEAHTFNPADFKRKVDNIPEIIVDKDGFEAASSIYKRELVDPIDPPMIKGFEMNPIYHFRLMIAEWQANRYKSYKEKKKLLEVKLLRLRLLRDGKNDPKLDKEIEYIESLVDKLEYSMSKMEEDVKNG
jgi:phage terminase small subunit